MTACRQAELGIESNNDVLDSLYGEDYGLTDPTTLNVITASAPLLRWS